MRRALFAACAVAATLAFACGGSEDTPPASGGSSGKGGSIGASGAGGAGVSGASGKAGASGKGFAGGSGAAGAAGAAGAPMATWLDCQDSDQAWVRKALAAVMGRRAASQAEVNVYVDLIASVDALDGVTGGGPTLPPDAPLKHSRRVALEAMRKHTDAAGKNEYRRHFLDVVRDALRVQRLEAGQNGGQANAGCYDGSKRPDDPSLAELIRDAAPDSPGDGAKFTMRDVISSSLALDDLSPVYVANVIAMLQYSYDGANADPLKLELARRSDFGAWFDAVYLHRDGVCLQCHNSENSVTFSPDPTKNRFFPLPGHLDAALFDSSQGNAPKALASVPGAPEWDGISREHAVLRFDGVISANNATQVPWGWDPSCGTIVPRAKIPADPALVDAKLGVITGNKATAWDVTDSLARGFAKLRDHGLKKAADGSVADADEAFAYLVSSNVVELVWKEIVGTPLTIANYFPRNAAARDQLAHLVDGFVASGFSPSKLLELITASPAFNIRAPDAGCGGAPYAMPAIYDPWVIAEEDPARRGNSLGDGVAPLSSRSLLRTTYRALGWAVEPPSFFADPNAESDFQGEVGLFMKNSEPGFRGFDFQARLSWEDRFATCEKPGSLPDYVDELLLFANGNGSHGSKKIVDGVHDAKARDVVAALKDRLVGDARIDEKAERPALEAVLGVSLDAPSTKVSPAGLRRVCGALVSSPQFLLGGLVPQDAATLPKLLPPAFGYTTTCNGIATAGLDGLSVSCAGPHLSVSQ